MAAASITRDELVEIIRGALALAFALSRGRLESVEAERSIIAKHGKAADRLLTEGVDLDTVFAALRNLQRHFRAQPRRPVDLNPQREAAWQLVTRRWSAREKAGVRYLLRRALTPTGPLITIPKLGTSFHIRYGSDDGIEIVTDNGVRSGRDIVLRLRVERHPGGRPTVPQELIDELDRKACATLTAAGKPLAKKARAGLIQPALAAKGYHRAEGTIQNRLNANRP